MPLPVQDTAVVSEGLGQLTSAFADKANVTGILSVLLSKVQDLENAIADYIFKIQLANHPLAGGPYDVLDKYGTIVGEPRNGRADVDYLAALKIRIRVNRSQGLAEDILQITALLAPGGVYQEFFPAAFVMSVIDVGTSVASALLSVLGEARSAGTAGQLRYTTWSGNLWIMGDSTGSNVGATGLMDSVSGQFPNAPASLGDL